MERERNKKKSRIRRANDPSRRRARRNNRAFALLDIHSNRRCPSRARFGRACVSRKSTDTRETIRIFFSHLLATTIEMRGGRHTHTHTHRAKKRTRSIVTIAKRVKIILRARVDVREEEKRTSFYSLSSDKFFCEGGGRKKEEEKKTG